MRWHSCMAGGRWLQFADDGARTGQLIIDDLHRSGRCIGAVRGRASNKPGLWIFICSLALHWHDRLGRGGWRNNLCMLLSAIYRFKKNNRFKKLCAIYVGIKASCRLEKSIVRWSLNRGEAQLKAMGAAATPRKTKLNCYHHILTLSAPPLAQHTAPPTAQTTQTKAQLKLATNFQGTTHRPQVCNPVLPLHYWPCLERCRSAYPIGCRLIVSFLLLVNWFVGCSIA